MKIKELFCRHVWLNEPLTASNFMIQRALGKLGYKVDFGKYCLKCGKEE